MDRDELQLTANYGLRQRIIDPCHVQLSADGKASVAMWRDARKTAKEIEYFSTKDAAAWLELSETVAAALKMGFPTSPVKPAKMLLGKALARSLPRLKHLGAIIDLVSGSHAGVLEEMFESDIVRASLLTGLPFMNFQDDMSAFAMIYLAALQSTGISMFEGGTGAFPAALVRCLEAHGGAVRTDAKVDSFMMRDGAVVGVILESGEEIAAPKGVVTAYSPKAVLNHTLPRGVLSDPLQNRASRIPTNKRGIADYKLNIALKGRIQPTGAQAWRNNRGVEISRNRIANTYFSIFEEPCSGTYNFGPLYMIC